MNEKQYHHIAQIEKLLPDLVRSAMMIENIPTTIIEIQTIMSNATVVEKTLTENAIIYNQASAWREAIRLLNNDEFQLSKAILQHLHKIATHQQDYNAGHFRKINVNITNTIHQPPQPYLLEKTWEQFLSQSEKIADIEEKSTFIFGEIARNQFFTDGNKRLANLMASCHQIQYGKMPFLIPITDQKNFYHNLRTYYEDKDHQQLHKYLIQHKMVIDCQPKKEAVSL